MRPLGGWAEFSDGGMALRVYCHHRTLSHTHTHTPQKVWSSGIPTGRKWRDCMNCGGGGKKKEEDWNNNTKQNEKQRAITGLLALTTGELDCAWSDQRERESERDFWAEVNQDPRSEKQRFLTTDWISIPNCGKSRDTGIHMGLRAVNHKPPGF